MTSEGRGGAHPATVRVQFTVEDDPVAPVAVEVQECPQYAESHAKEFPCGG